MLVDGRQVYADYYGFTPWATVPIEFAEIRQIEVVKGPSGALFGFNAVAGVINIITHGVPREFASSLSATVGSQNLEQTSLVTSVPFGDRVGLDISAGVRRSDDFSTPLRAVDEGTRRGNGRESVRADVHFELTERLSFGVEGAWSAAEQATFPPAYAMAYEEYETRSLRTHWAADTKIGLVQADLYRNSIDATPYLLDSTVPLQRFDNRVTIARVENLFKIGARHVMNVSLERRENSMATTPLTGARVGYSVGAFAVRWNVAINDRLSVTNALRWDDWQLEREGFMPDPLVQLGLTNDLWSRSLTRASFNSGIVARVFDRATVRFSAGRGQQTPSLLMLGGSLGEAFGEYFSGHPFLNPAAVSSYELAWEQRIARGLTFEASAYTGRTSDVLANAFNIGSSRTKGAEVGLSGDIGRHWRFSVAHATQRIDDDFLAEVPLSLSFTDFEHTTPRHTTKGAAGWSRGPWEVDGFVRHVGRFSGIRSPDIAATEASLFEVPAHVAVDARVGYRYSERLTLAVSGQNLNSSVQTQTSGPAVERRVLASATVTF